LFCLALAAAHSIVPSVGAGKDDPQTPPEAKKIQLVLQASPRYGFQPLDVTLYARLEGVPGDDDRFCHAGVEWIGETRGGRVMRSTEDARCIHPDELTRVEHTFSKYLHLYRPAIYRYHIVLHLKDGGEIKSNLVDVRVISNQ
jgi:hypothetical protein